MITITKNNGKPRLENDGTIFSSGGMGSLISEKLKLSADQDTIDLQSTFTAVLDAPEAVLEAHKDYVLAGAKVITTDTFRGFQRKMDRSDFGRFYREIKQNPHSIFGILPQLLHRKAKAKKILTAAFKIACEAANIAPDNKPAIAISLGPIEECYDPEKTPERNVLEREHGENVALIKQAIENLPEHSNQTAYLIGETLPSFEEGEVIAQQAEASGVPFVISFTVDDGGRVLDGTSMDEVAEKIAANHSHCLGIGVNCCSIEGAKAAVSALSKAFEQRGLEGKHIFAEANGFVHSHEKNSEHDCRSHIAIEPEIFAKEAWNLVQAGATGVGGCCGTTPEHTRAYVDHVNQKQLEQTPVLIVTAQRDEQRLTA